MKVVPLCGRAEVRPRATPSFVGNRPVTACDASFFLPLPPPALPLLLFSLQSLLFLTWLYPCWQPSGFVSIRSNQEQP